MERFTALRVSPVERLAQVVIGLAREAPRFAIDKDRVRLSLEQDRHPMRLAFVDGRQAREDIRLIHVIEPGARALGHEMGIPFIAARRAETVERPFEIFLPQRGMPIEPPSGEHDATLRDDAALAGTGVQHDTRNRAVALIKDEIRYPRLHLDAASGIDAALQKAGHERAALASSVRNEPMQQTGPSFAAARIG